MINDYIFKTFRLELLFFPVYIVIRFLLMRCHNEKCIIKKEVIFALFAVYIIALASQTIVPRFEFTNEGLEFWINNKDPNIVPFKTITQYLRDVNNDVDCWQSYRLLYLSVHILLFVPFGILFPLIMKINSKKISFYSLINACLLFSVIIEIIQFLIGRVADIDDIIFNTISSAIGYLLYKMVISKNKFDVMHIND